MSLTDDFIRELTRVGGEGHKAQGLAQAIEIYWSINEGIDIITIPRVRWSTPTVEMIDPAAGELPPSMPREQAIKLCAAAYSGLTEADFGIAETGTLVLSSGNGRNRLVSLLPPFHIAVLPESCILPSLVSFTERFADPQVAEGFKDMTCLTMVTGPSRTADIEMTLTLGVHGPQRLHTIILLGV